MEHPYILDNIRQRMRELGHENYHFETIKVANPDPLVPQAVIDASNQYYYLVEKVVDPSLEIISDTDTLLASESVNYSNFTFHNFREFTGQIFIQQSTSFDLEFIRVSPYAQN